MSKKSFFRKKKINRKKFIAQKLLILEHSSFHQKVLNHLLDLPSEFKQKAHMGPEIKKISSNGLKQKWKNLFLTETQKIKKRFSIFFSDEIPHLLGKTF